MRKLMLLLATVSLFSFTLAPSGIPKKERKEGMKYLKETKKNLHKAVKGLSEAQLNFKADTGRWSIAECMTHIALAEAAIWQMYENGAKAAPDPSKRSEVKMTTEQLKAAIVDRSKKFQAPEFLQPAKAPTKFATTAEALAAFDAQHDKIMDYLKTTDADLMNIFMPHPAFGTLDAYQFLMFIGAHTRRHTLQIEEVKANPNFPKS
jgi:DinB superfamily